MVPLTELWLPILLSAVIVFVASSLIHMVLGWHKSEYPALAEEARFRDAVAPLAIPPGDYMVPRAQSMKEYGTAEFKEKLTRGPVVIMTVLRNEQTGMGRALGMWFVYSLIVSVFAAYVAGRALGDGVRYLEVFRFAGATAFAGYSLALLQNSIWYHRAWSTTIKAMVDGLIYALLTAGVFGWLWPGATH